MTDRPSDDAPPDSDDGILRPRGWWAPGPEVGGEPIYGLTPGAKPPRLDETWEMHPTAGGVRRPGWNPPAGAPPPQPVQPAPPPPAWYPVAAPPPPPAFVPLVPSPLGEALTPEDRAAQLRALGLLHGG